MFKGIRISAGGMQAIMKAQEVIANNLANVSTVGFKKDEAVFENFATILKNKKKTEIKNVVDITSISTDFSQGQMQKTDNPLDFSIVGKGFFAVETPDGVRYTRAGNFTTNFKGELTTLDGYTLQGRSGAVVIGQGKQVSFGDDGSVFVDGNEITKIKVISFSPETKLVKTGGNLFALAEGEEMSDKGEVRSGFLEQSTVNTIEEMVKMTTYLRTFEANQKAIRIQDDTLDKAVNSVGKV